METLVTWLVAGGVVAVLGALAFVYFKFLRGKSTVEGAVSTGGKMVSVIAGMLPDDTSKLDAHDVVLVIGRLLEALPEWAKDESNQTFLDVKDEVMAFVEQQRDTIPHLEKLPKDVVEKVAEGLFMVVKALMSLKSA